MGMFGDVFSSFWKSSDENKQSESDPNTNVSNANGTTSATTEARQAAGQSEQIAIGAQNSKTPTGVEVLSNVWNLSDEERQKSQMPQFEAFGADVTPEKILEAARQVDFTKQIPQELMEKVLAGDQTALLQLVNGVGQNAYAQSAMTSVNAAREASNKQIGYLTSQLPDLVRNLQNRNEAAEDNPLATNPATKPMFDMLFNQYQKKYPEATAAELKNHTTQHLNHFIQTAGGTLPQAPVEPGSSKLPKVIGGDDSWNSFFS